MKIATQNIIEEGINNTGKKYKLKARCDGRFFHFRTILTLSTLKLSVNWGKLDSTATRCGKEPSLLLRFGIKPLTGTAKAN